MLIDFRREHLSELDRHAARKSEILAKYICKTCWAVERISKVPDDILGYVSYFQLKGYKVLTVAYLMMPIGLVYDNLAHLRSLLEKVLLHDFWVPFFNQIQRKQMGVLVVGIFGVPKE